MTDLSGEAFGLRDIYSLQESRFLVLTSKSTVHGSYKIINRDT